MTKPSPTVRITIVTDHGKADAECPVLCRADDGTLTFDAEPLMQQLMALAAERVPAIRAEISAHPTRTPDRLLDWMDLAFLRPMLLRLRHVVTRKSS